MAETALLSLPNFARTFEASVGAGAIAPLKAEPERWTRQAMQRKTELISLRGARFG